MDARTDKAPIAYQADDRDGLRASNLAKAFKGGVGATARIRSG